MKINDIKEKLNSKESYINGWEKNEKGIHNNSSHRYK